MVTSLSDESALLTELRALAGRGRHREVLSQLEGLSADMLQRRTPFALLAAEAHGRLGAHAEAERWAQVALVIARSRGERHAELRARNYQGAIALERGEVDAAEPHFAAALELARVLEDHAAEARGLNNLGIIANLRGDPREALASYQLALAAYQQAGLVRGMAETQHNIGISFRDLGDYPRALAAPRKRCGSQSNRCGTKRSQPWRPRGARSCTCFRETPELAGAELALAAAAYERLQHPVGLAEVWRLQAAVARAGGDTPGAVALLSRAAELARGQGSAHTLAEIERDLGAALAASGDRAGAKAARERAAAVYRRLGAAKAAGEIAALLT